MTAEKTAKTVEQLRAEFRRCRENAKYVFDAEEWMAEVQIQLAGITNGAEPTPEDWVEAAKRASLPCPDCRGTGVYSWGAQINGKMQHSGPCFRCQGTGWQTQADCARNRTYDNHRKLY